MRRTAGERHAADCFASRKPMTDVEGGTRGRLAVHGSRRQVVERVRRVGEDAPVARLDAEKEDEPAFDERDKRRLEVERVAAS